MVVKVELANEAFLGLLRPELVEDRIAVGVDYEAGAVDFQRLDPMGVVADYQIGSGVDGQVG